MMNQLAKKSNYFFKQTNLLEKIREETGIEIWELKNAAGILINECSATTIQQANSHYESAPLGSRERFEAKLKLDHLCLEAIEKSNDFYEILSIFKFTTHQSRSNTRALEKMLELADDNRKLECLIGKCVDMISQIKINAIKKLIALNTDVV